MKEKSRNRYRQKQDFKRTAPNGIAAPPPVLPELPSERKKREREESKRFKKPPKKKRKIREK